MFGAAVEAGEDARALQQIGTKLRVSRNKTIFNEGDPAEYSYKVVSGTVRLCKHMTDGRRQIAQFLFPGDFFSFADFGEHSFTAEAVTDVVLVSYAQRQVAQLCEERRSVNQRLLTFLSQRICAMQDHLILLGCQAAKGRIASFLLQLSEQTGSEEDQLFDVPMSRLDIADYLGLRIETVCRVLSEMKRMRVIDMLDVHQFELLDSDTLQALADGEE